MRSFGCYVPPEDVCEICGVETRDLGPPPNYPSAFMACCYDCRGMGPAERVAAWGRKVSRGRT